MKDIISKLKGIFLSKQFTQFLIGGGTAFVIDFSILNILDSVVHLDTLITQSTSIPSNIAIIVPNIISTFTAICYNFFYQKHFAFKGKGQESKNKILKFFAANGFNLVIFNVIGFGILTSLGIAVPIAKIIVTAMQMLSSFFLYRNFVFREKK